MNLFNTCCNNWLHTVTTKNADMIKGGFLLFLTKLSAILDTAKERNDPSLPNISLEYIDKLEELLRKQLALKARSKKLAQFGKDATALNVEEKVLKDLPGWAKIHQLKQKFNIPGVPINWVINAYTTNYIEKLSDIQRRFKPAVAELNMLQRKKSTTKTTQGFQRVESFRNLP